MSAIGRNQPCRCGSGKKTKRCCGVQHGPSESQLATAFLATHSRQAAPRLLPLPTAQIHELFEQMLDLPGRHLSLQLPLPRLLPPELEGLRAGIVDDDLDRIDEVIDTALAHVDTPEQRAALARAAIGLAEAGVIDNAIADTAIVDLDSASSALLRMSLLHALSVSAGASRTPSGLVVVSR